MFDQNREQHRLGRDSGNAREAGTPKVTYEWKMHTELELLRFMDEIKRQLAEQDAERARSQNKSVAPK